MSENKPFTPNEGKAFLFLKKEGASEKAPDYRGTFTLNSISYDFAIWAKENEDKLGSLNQYYPSKIQSEGEILLTYEMPSQEVKENRLKEKRQPEFRFDAFVQGEKYELAFWIGTEFNKPFEFKDSYRGVIKKKSSENNSSSTSSNSNNSSSAENTTQQTSQNSVAYQIDDNEVPF